MDNARSVNRVEHKEALRVKKPKEILTGSFWFGWVTSPPGKSCNAEFMLMIEIMPGKKISLEVRPFDTIQDLKLKIPPSEWNQRDFPDLFYNGKYLNDYFTLDDYNISQSSTLECRLGLNISVKTVSGETISVKVASSNTTIGNLKAQIPDKEDDTEFLQWLFFDGRPLDNKCTLVDYKIMDGSTLLLIRRPKGWIPIYANTHAGKTISLEVQISDTIRDFKFRIEEMDNDIYHYNQILFTGKQLLNSNCTLIDYIHHVISLSSFSLAGSAADFSHRLNEIFGFAADSVHLLKDKNKKTSSLMRLFGGLSYPMYYLGTGMTEFMLDIQIRPEKTISLAVRPSDTIRNLKLKIPPSEWNHIHLPDFFYKGKYLNDNHTLESYGISCYSTLKCWLGLKISVRTMCGKTVSVEVDSSDATIGNLKAKIQDKEGVSQFQQKLFFNGRQLKNKCTLADYKIEDGSTLLLVRRSKGWIPMYVKTHAGKTISLEVKSSDTIGDLKIKINEVDDILPYKQNLFLYGEQLLDNNCTLTGYNIHPESTLLLVPVCRGRMKIYVETIRGNTITLDVISRYTIGVVKSLIQDKEGIRLHEQTLVYEGQKLDDSRTLVSYLIQDETTLRLVDDTLMREPMQIHVEIVATGKTIRLQVETFDTINSVKSKIQSQEDIPYEQQRLFLPQIQLKDDCTLADYYIHNESTLYLVVTLIKIAVKTPVGKSIALDVDSSDTIWNVKAKIQDVEGIPRDHQTLLLAEEQLKDSFTLAKYCVKNESTLHLLVTSDKLFVDTISNVSQDSDCSTKKAP